MSRMPTRPNFSHASVDVIARAELIPPKAGSARHGLQKHRVAPIAAGDGRNAMCLPLAQQPAEEGADDLAEQSGRTAIQARAEVDAAQRRQIVEWGRCR